VPFSGSTFLGWSGACPGVGVCTLRVTADESVVAMFGSPPFVLKTDLTGVDTGGADWGDYDNDGRLDLAVVGMTQTGAATLTRVYHNTGGQLSDSGLTFLNVDSVARWGDYNNDGYLDLLVGGWSASPTKGQFLQLYTNTGMGFVPGNSGLPNSVTAPDVAWGDYDRDGNLDVAVAGYWSSATGYPLHVYRNDHGTFVDSATIPQTPGTSASWGDYDNDGDLDLLAVGDYQGTHLYRNDGGRFVEVGHGLIAVDGGVGSWVDFDGDGRPDIVIAGALPGSNQLVTRLYRGPHTLRRWLQSTLMG
jgi:hypothetical protein